MDRLVRIFAERTPVHLLENHRQLMRKCVRSILDNLYKSVLAAQSGYVQSENFLSEDCIVTGSMAEGASLARLFSPDSKTSREYEIDIMIPLAEWPTEEGMIYVENNKAFLHIVVGSEILSLVRSFCGEDGVKTSLCQKDDGTYMSSSQLTKANFKQAQIKSINKLGFRCCNTDKQCVEGNASVAVQIDEVIDRETEPSETSAMSFASREAQLSADAAATHLRLTKEMIPHCETFEIRITEMLAHLETVQYEFMEMRKSGEAIAPLYSQASKALEWALTCADIADVIFDARQSTAFRYVKESLGVTIGMTEESKNHEQIKQNLETYIDQLTISKDDISNVSVASAVCELLSDIERTEIAPQRYLTIFREFARRQQIFFKIITWGDQNPQLLQIPQPMQELSGSLERSSFDFVPCFKLMFWPSVAAEWKARCRKWPGQTVIEEIVSNGAHLIAKAFCHVDIDWRLSFSVAEIELASLWSPAQHFVYFIFKSLFYKFIKPLNTDNAAAAADDDVSPSTSSKKYLTSYTAKTVMMWTSESSDQSWWTEVDAGECLTVLLLALQSAVQCRTLDHYFVSSVNLLEGLPDVLASRVIDTIDFILADPAAISGQLGNDFEKTEIFFNAMPAQTEFEKNLSDFASMLSSFSSFST